MKKTPPYRVTIIGTFLVTITIVGVVKFAERSESTPVQQAEAAAIHVSVSTIVRTHSGPTARNWNRFNLKGTLKYHVNTASDSQTQFERKVALTSDGSVFRYDKMTFNTSQSYLFDGKTVVRTTSQPGTQVEVKTLVGVDAGSIRFQIATAGLLPALKRLSDPETKVSYAGSTVKGNRFEVTTNNGTWRFYSNSNHLIERLEVGEVNIIYSDYRAVDGLTLPYYQKVTKGDTLLYEIKFDTFELPPAPPPKYSRT